MEGGESCRGEVAGCRGHEGRGKAAAVLQGLEPKSQQLPAPTTLIFDSKMRSFPAMLHGGKPTS